jgi:multidrug efflux pump subunit AcrB
MSIITPTRIPASEPPWDLPPTGDGGGAGGSGGDDAAGAGSRARRSWVTSVAVTASRRWRVTLCLFIVVVLAGVYAFGFGLNREGFPPVNTPISIVTGTYFVDDAERVDAEVVAPLAAAFAEADGVVEVATDAQPSSFAVIVEFDDSIDSDVGTQRLVDLGVEVTDAATVDYRAVNAAKFIGEYDLLVSIVGPPGATAAELEAQAATLATSLLAGVDSVERADVRNLLTTSVDPTTGEAETRPTRFTRVALGPEGYTDAITVGLVRSPDTELDVLGFSDTIDAALEAAEADLAPGFRAEITADFATGVRTQLSSLSGNLLTGLAAVALVSLLLIGWRVAVLTGGFMALVLLGSLIGLLGVGYTLNTITLFGLILTLGLLVDDAIVISESIDANRDSPDPSEPDPGIGVIRRAIDRVGSASLAGTLTTVVVFSPMLFVGGILGEFIRPIPATVIVTLLLSFAFSIVFIPAIARVFLVRGGPSRNPVVRVEKRVAAALGRLAAYPSGNGWRGRFAGFGLAGFGLATVIVGMQLAGGLGFSIFPAGKDAVGLIVAAEFPPGTTIEEAEERADRIDAVVVDVLGDELVRSQYVRGNERVIETFIDLTPIDERSTTAPTFVERIEAGVAGIEGARITVNQTESGPPVLEFPFAVQIGVDGDAPTLAAAETLADEIRDDLIGRSFDSGSETVTVTDALVSTRGSVARVDGERYIEVRAQYDAVNGISGVLTSTEDHVVATFGPTLADRGLAADALVFDFGLESDNQDDFAALGVAGMVALGLMLVLITVQFRSLAQSILIFLAIPFSFLGVFSALTVTDNPLSFLAVVGFIALIGVAVNNTILLVDAANQERRLGATAGEAIGSAVTSRFRPLVATTVTTVVGLLPLSLADPFWESLGFTLMGGLVSSTLLVLVAFPAFYLGLEAVRTPLRNAVRRRRGRPLVA